MFVKERNRDEWGCRMGEAEVVMPDVRNWTFGIKYYEHMIAARPQARLIK